MQLENWPRAIKLVIKKDLLVLPVQSRKKGGQSRVAGVLIILSNEIK